MVELTVPLVHEIFAGMSNGDPPSFMKYVAEDVKWTVSNPDEKSKSHPLAGFYSSRAAFVEGTLKVLGEKLKEPLYLRINQEPLVFNNRAAIELTATTPSGAVPEGKNGVRFDNRYAWIVTWDPEKEKIVEVRAYLDSAAVVQVCA